MVWRPWLISPMHVQTVVLTSCPQHTSHHLHSCSRVCQMMEMTYKVCPDPLPISCAQKALPSSDINTDKLSSVEDVLKKNGHLRAKGSSESNVRHLCVKLAKEAIFGDDILVRCTPGGTRELYELKKIILQQLPQYWKCRHLFAATWKKCRDTLDQGCK